MRVITVVSRDYKENAYLYYDEDSNVCVAVDPGGDAGKIRDAIDDHGLNLAGVLLTHGHFDHVSAVSRLRCAKDCAAPVYAHEYEDGLLANPDMNMSRMLMDEPISVVPDFLLGDGDEMNIGGVRLTVLHTPGHTAGSCCFYDEEGGVLFSGDTLFFETIGRTDLPTSNTAELADSVLNRLFTLPDDTTVYPGHGKPTTIGYEKTHNAAALALGAEFSTRNG